jgi:hypothetical protein
MLAAPKLKLFFRCGESESARWISDTIGEYEVEKPKIGTTASVEDKGRDAVNYSTVTEHKQAISKEQIMSLPDLHGYWKYADVVVPFRLPLAPVKIVARGYIPREMTPSEIHIPTLHQDVKKKSARAPKRGEQGTKRHEHLIAETGKQLGGALAANMSEAAHPGSMAPEDEKAITPETEQAVLEIGVDPELEAAQIEM